MLGVLQEYTNTNPDMEWATIPDILTKIGLDAKDKNYHRYKTQLDYLLKQNEVERRYSGGENNSVYCATNDGYNAYWDDKYINMRNERWRIAWNFGITAASAILLIVLNFILISKNVK